MVYTPFGSTFKISTENIQTDTVKAWWFDTSIGEAIHVGDLEVEPKMTFDPPADEKRGNDWGLVLDAGDQNFAVPGK